MRWLLTLILSLLATLGAHHQKRRHHRRRHPHPLSYAVASWYEDAGQTACGFHARYGVANLSLSCGTRVTICYPASRGRCLIATVQDRGPYVAGRTFDLNQTLAGALGFTGVQTVAYRIGG